MRGTPFQTVSGIIPQTRIRWNSFVSDSIGLPEGFKFRGNYPKSFTTSQRVFAGPSAMCLGNCIGQSSRYVASLYRPILA